MNDLAVFPGALTMSAAGHLHNRPASYCLVHRLMHVLRCADGERDVDILFFGAMNPQREAIIADVNTSGLAVRVLSGGTMLFGGGSGQDAAQDQDCAESALLPWHHGAALSHPCSVPP